MAIDLDAIRRKHEEISSPAGTGGGDSSFFDNFIQLLEGINVVRILPG